jgi:hypothetical protein
MCSFVPGGNQTPTELTAVSKEDSLHQPEVEVLPWSKRPLQPYADARYFYDPDFYPEATETPFKDPKDEFRVDL